MIGLEPITCHDDTINAQLAVKAFRYGYRILTSHGINHQKDFLRFYHFLDVLQFLHQFFIDMQTTCCIDEDDIIAVFRCVFQRFLGNFHGTEFVPHFKYGNVVVFPNYLQLFDSRRTIHVTGYQQITALTLAASSRREK